MIVIHSVGGDSLLETFTQLPLNLTSVFIGGSGGEQMNLKGSGESYGVSVCQFLKWHSSDKSYP